MSFVTCKQMKLNEQLLKSREKVYHFVYNTRNMWEGQNDYAYLYTILLRKHMRILFSQRSWLLKKTAICLFTMRHLLSCYYSNVCASTKEKGNLWLNFQPHSCHMTKAMQSKSLRASVMVIGLKMFPSSNRACINGRSEVRRTICRIL